MPSSHADITSDKEYKMNYELAKKLKDAGFPQGDWVAHKELTPKGYRTTYYYEIYIPTLSELIEACHPLAADDFGIILNHKGEWEAYLIYYGYFDCWPEMKNEDGACSIRLESFGSTPEEAVANLWLSLNKK